jgi:CheY-like chemotaxis protein
LPGRTILFADDSATMRTIMEKTFHDEAFDVVTVPSGEAALAKVKEIRPDIVLVDAGMAGVNGYDVCKGVRDDASLAGIPVIIMSGVSSPYDEGRGRDVGATDHVKKPFDTTKLIEKVTELCGAPKEASAPAAAPAPVPPRPAPAPGATLHAFPTPGGFSAPKPPTLPVAPRPPVPPVSPPPAILAPKAGPKETMEFGRPRFEAAKPQEVKPIELDEPSDDVGAIQVGTLAELAQMNERGEHIPPEDHEGAIEIDEPQRTPAVEPVPPPARVAPAVPAAASMEASISAAASAVAARVEGVTAQQAEAIRRLTAEVIEKVVWEVVPDLAETIIRERIQELLKE